MPTIDPGDAFSIGDNQSIKSSSSTQETSNTPHTKGDEDAFSVADTDDESDHSPPKKISDKFCTEKLSYRKAELLSYRKAELLFPGLVLSPRKNRDEQGILVFYDDRGNKSITSEIRDSQYQEAIQNFAKKRHTKTSALIKITDTPKCFEMGDDVQNLIDSIKVHCKTKKGSNAKILRDVAFLELFLFDPLPAYYKKRKIESTDLDELIEFIDNINKHKLKYDPRYYLKELKDKIKEIKDKIDPTEKEPYAEFITEIDRNLEKHKQKKELYAITSQNNGWTATTILNKRQFKEIQEDNFESNNSNQDSLLEFIANQYKTIHPQTNATPKQEEFYNLFEDALSSIGNSDKKKYYYQAEKLKQIKDLYNKLNSDQDQEFLKKVFGDKFNDFDKLMKEDYSAYYKHKQVFKQNLEDNLKEIDPTKFTYESVGKDPSATNFDTSFKYYNKDCKFLSDKNYEETLTSIDNKLSQFERQFERQLETIASNTSCITLSSKQSRIKKSQELIENLKKALTTELTTDDNKLKINAIKNLLRDTNFTKHQDSELQKELKLLEDYYSRKKEGETSAASLILDTRNAFNNRNLSIGNGLFTICNNGSNNFQLIINRDVQEDNQDNVFFKNIGRDKYGNNYYIRIFVAKGGETIYGGGQEFQPNKIATKGEIVLDTDTIWCAKDEKQINKGQAIRTNAASTPQDIQDKLKQTNIMVLEAENDKITESTIFMGGKHSKIVTQKPKTKIQASSAEPVGQKPHEHSKTCTC